MQENEQAIVLTKKWIEKIVIAQNFCPFARQPFVQDKIRYEVASWEQWEQGLEELIQACAYLESHEEIETSLLIYPTQLPTFSHYLDFLGVSEQLLMDQGYEGIFQLASFHPTYQFAGTDIEDAANYTNRSPFPMLHILREDSLETAIARHPDSQEIPQRNIAHARKMGSQAFQNILNDLKT